MVDHCIDVKCLRYMLEVIMYSQKDQFSLVPMKRKKKNGHLLYLRIIRIWNTLSDELNLGMNNVDDFKHALMCYYSTAL